MKKYNKSGDYLLSCITYRSGERDLNRIAKTGGIAYTTFLTRIKGDFGNTKLSELQLWVDRYGITDQEIVNLVRGKKG